jgi:hypothetical protein
MALQPFGLRPLFQLPNHVYTRHDSLDGDQPVANPLPIQRTRQAQNKRTQTSIPRVGFEPTIPVFQQAKTVNALDRAASLIYLLYLKVCDDGT